MIEALERLVKALQDFVKSLMDAGAKPPIPSVPKEVLLNGLFLAMRRQEGWFAGSRSQRNNNPLNTRYSTVGYLPKYGTVKRDANNFAIFKDLATGTLYCKNLILEKAKKHPDWDLFDFIGNEGEGWAPASDDNNVEAYVKAIATEMKVYPHTWTLSNLL